MPPPSLTAPAVTRRRNEEPGSKVLHPAAENGSAEGRKDKKMGAPATGGWRRPEWCPAAGVVRRHPLPALFGCGLLLFMAVEYTIPMVQPTAPPLDLGFVATKGMHAAVAERPWLNSLLAALNTVSNPSHEPFLFFLPKQQQTFPSPTTLFGSTCLFHRIRNIVQ
jgi:hypothetical protein